MELIIYFWPVNVAEQYYVRNSELPYRASHVNYNDTCYNDNNLSSYNKKMCETKTTFTHSTTN